MKVLRIVLGLMLFTSVSSAFASSTVVCTGNLDGHAVQVTQGFNSTLDGIGYSAAQLSVAVDGKELTQDRLSYTQATTFYVSPDRDIATMLLLNDGQQILLNVEYLGAGQALNRIQVSNSLLAANRSGALADLTSASCKITRQ